MTLVTLSSPKPPTVPPQSRHRRAGKYSLAQACLICLLCACTTPNQAGRLLFQRGATQLPSKPLVWQPFTGQIAIDHPQAAPLRSQVIEQLNQLLKPRAETAPLSLRLQGVIVACREGATAACACRVVIELVGKDRQTVLRGMEGRAELAMARPADKDALSRALPTLISSAVEAALTAPDRRPPAVSDMARLIRAGDSSQLNQWAAQLEQQALSPQQRIVLWVALGHVAKARDLKRLNTIPAKSVAEAKARTRALLWIRAAAP